MSTVSTLTTATNYDDQGLFVSLLVGAAILVSFGGFIAFLHCTNILWLKRFYRPNHTVEPAPLASSRATDSATRRISASQTPTPPTTPAGQTVFAEHTVRPHGHQGRALTRRKRLGVSLPFVSTFFVRPRWRDLISIEELSLRDRKDGALSAVHTRAPTAAMRHTSDRSFVPIQVTPSPLLPTSPGDTDTFPSEYPHDATAAAASAATGSSGKADARGNGYASYIHAATPSYGAVEAPSPTRQTQQPQTQQQQQQPLASSQGLPTPTSRLPQPGNPLPKTPTDPLVAVYLFTLKFFCALMFFGAFFTVWIMPLAHKDDYMERTMLQRDIHGCGKQDDNETGCNELKPYCKFHGVAIGCAVVPLHGVYDLTVSNIKPRSWRWMRVALLNLGFCFVLVSLTLYYLHKVGQYVDAVMANQMRHALGYRVVCIRGLDTTDVRSENALRKNFLELPVYFPSERMGNRSSTSPPPPSSTSLTTPNTAARQARERNSYVTNDSIFSEYHPEDDSYTICECPGLNCLFSTAGVHYYVVRREDATFTEPGKVEQILITREPPFGLLDTIADTESAMANLQEAIADEKALQRKLDIQREAQNTERSPLRRRRVNGGIGGLGAFSGPTPLRTTSVFVADGEDGSSGGGGGGGGGGGSSRSVNIYDRARHEDDRAVLMMRRGFPACCDKMPAVPYYESVFFKCAAELNQALEQVPHQPVAGAAFVVFTDSLCAFEFMQLFTARFGGMFSSLTATIAGPPGRIFQNSLTAGRCALYMRFFIIFWLYIFLIFTWSIPISFLGSLESLSQIPGIGRFLTEFTSLSSTLQSLVNAYLPVVVLALFNVALPHIIRVLVRMMGAFNRVECDGGQLYLQYVFMVMTAVIAQAAFQGAMNRLADLLFDPNEEAIINFIIACVTPSNGYFYAKIISATCLSTWVDLLDPFGILKALLLRGSAHIQRNYDALFMPCEFEFPRLLSFDLMILSMGLLFHMTTPLLGLLSILYFVVRYWTQRAKQTDRYRPTLSPAHDCTDFGVPAQVIRSVMWLYCFSELGGVLLMGLRDHSGGVVLCSISLGIGIALTIYVYIKTRRWTACLACARHFSEQPHPYHHTHPIRSQQQQRKQRKAQLNNSLGGSTAGPQDGLSPSQSQSTSPQPSQPQPPVEEPTVTTPLRFNAARATQQQNGGGPFPRQPLDHSQSLSSSGNAGPLGVSQNTVSSPETPFETNPVDDPEERQLGTANRRNDVIEDGAMDGYEHVTLHQVLFDTTRNPFLSHLLPRKPGVTLRFQPKHQRIAPINAAAEVRIMQETNFVVERYWDKGMTWFEEDTADRNWDGETIEGDSTDGDVVDDRFGGRSGATRDGDRGSAGARESGGGMVSSGSAANMITLSQPPSRLKRSGSSSGRLHDAHAMKMRVAEDTETRPSPPHSPEAVVLAAEGTESEEEVRAQAAASRRSLSPSSSPPPPPVTTTTAPPSAISAQRNAATTAATSPTSAVWQASDVATRSSPTPSKASSATPPPLPLRSTEESRDDEGEEEELQRQSLVRSMCGVQPPPTDASTSSSPPEKTEK